MSAQQAQSTTKSKKKKNKKKKSKKKKKVKWPPSSNQNTEVKRRCADCSQVKMGRIYDGDGSFYCHGCFNSYAGVPGDKEKALGGKCGTFGCKCTNYVESIKSKWSKEKALGGKCGT
eukprot:1105356_1